MKNDVVVRHRKILTIPVPILTAASAIPLIVWWAFYDTWKDEYFQEGLFITIFGTVLIVIPLIVWSISVLTWRIRVKDDSLFIRRFFTETEYKLATLKSNVNWQPSEEIITIPNSRGPHFIIKGRMVIHIMYQGYEIIRVSQHNKKYKEFVACIKDKIKK